MSHILSNDSTNKKSRKHVVLAPEPWACHGEAHMMGRATATAATTVTVVAAVTVAMKTTTATATTAATMTATATVTHGKLVMARSRSMTTRIIAM